MGNLAEKKIQSYQTQSVPKKRKNSQKAKISIAEKMLWSLFTIVFVCFAMSAVSDMTALYQVNMNNIETQSEISKIKTENEELQAEVDSLSTYERISGIAEKNGLEINEGNVKFLNE